MDKQIFINLAVENIEKSRKFFSELGFKINENFSNENVVCIVVAENIFVMLLTKIMLKGFLPHKDIADTYNTSEGLFAISMGSKQEVDTLLQKAITLGANEFREAQDHGFMYGRAFEDLDGHIWELFWMDQSRN